MSESLHTLFPWPQIATADAPRWLRAEAVRKVLASSRLSLIARDSVSWSDKDGGGACRQNAASSPHHPHQCLRHAGRACAYVGVGAPGPRAQRSSSSPCAARGRRSGGTRTASRLSAAGQQPARARRTDHDARRTEVIALKKGASSSKRKTPSAHTSAGCEQGAESSTESTCTACPPSSSGVVYVENARDKSPSLTWAPEEDVGRLEVVQEALGHAERRGRWPSHALICALERRPRRALIAEVIVPPVLHADAQLVVVPRRAGSGDARSRDPHLVVHLVLVLLRGLSIGHSTAPPALVPRLPIRH